MIYYMFYCWLNKKVVYYKYENHMEMTTTNEDKSMQDKKARRKALS
jgi:hypothetical protein